MAHLGELAQCASEIAGVICKEDLVELVPPGIGCAVAANPIQAAFKIHRDLIQRQGYFWTDFESVIPTSCRIHPRAHVSERNVVLGEGVEVGPNASVLENTIVGEGTWIGAGSTIGSHAFEMARIDGTPQLWPQIGGVRIGKGVVFLSNDTVARSVFPVFTEIGDHCGFDNLVHVAHDSVLGRGVQMTACSMISGRVTLGDNAYLGPNATVSNGVSIEERGYVTLGSVVTRNVPRETRVTGNFAIEHQDFIARLRRERAKG